VLTTESLADRTRKVRASGESNCSKSLATDENESKDESVDMDWAEKHLTYGNYRASRQLMP